MANVRVPTSTTTNSLLLGSMAVHTQYGERSRRAIASSLLIRLDQPGQYAIGVDLEDTSSGADAQPLGQARQHAHDEFHGCLFAMENRAVGFQEVALTGNTVELAPRATAGMAIGPQVVQPQPTAIVAAQMGTKVLRGVNLARASVGWGHWLRQHRRWGLRRRHLLLT